MRTIDIDGKTYGIDKMSLFDQFHVSRKLLPMVMAFTGNKGEAIVAAFMELSTMRDDEAEFILNKCLEVVKRKEGESWVLIKQKDVRVLQYADITLGTMMQLTVETIKENLGAFFDDAPLMQAQMAAGPDPQ